MTTNWKVRCYRSFVSTYKVEFVVITDNDIHQSFVLTEGNQQHCRFIARMFRLALRKVIAAEITRHNEDTELLTLSLRKCAILLSDNRGATVNITTRRELRKAMKNVMSAEIKKHAEAGVRA